MNQISESVRQFIFEHIDSAEQLDVLLLLWASAGKPLTIEEISGHLRSTPPSVEKRIHSLLSSGLVHAADEQRSAYVYRATRAETDRVVAALSDEYKLRKHQILMLIFSPIKRARHFADAFIVSKTAKNEEE